MNFPKVLVIIILVGCTLQTFGQCPQKIKVGTLKTDNEGKGKIDVNIQNAGPFNGKLVKITGTTQTTVQSFTGVGTKDFSFSSLSLDSDFYRIVVDFTSESKFLCKSKTIDVDITSRK